LFKLLHEEVAMISFALASMLLVAQAGSAGQARQAYADCLDKSLRTHLESKTDPAAFDTALTSACAAQAAAYRNAILAAEQASGASAADAAELAGAEIEDLEANTKDLYRAHLEDNTRPQ
jgi:hypothetical protein